MTMANPTIPGTSDNPLADYNTLYLDCRRGSGIGHKWDWQGPFYKVGGEVHRRAGCERCGGTKVARRTSRGGYLPTEYHPPKDYSLAGGITVQEMWMEMLSRNKVYRSEHEAMKQRKTAPTNTRQGRRGTKR